MPAQRRDGRDDRTPELIAFAAAAALVPRVRRQHAQWVVPDSPTSASVMLQATPIDVTRVRNGKIPLHANVRA